MLLWLQAMVLEAPQRVLQRVLQRVPSLVLKSVCDYLPRVTYFVMLLARLMEQQSQQLELVLPLVSLLTQ